MTDDIFLREVPTDMAMKVMGYEAMTKDEALINDVVEKFYVFIREWSNNNEEYNYAKSAITVIKNLAEENDKTVDDMVYKLCMENTDACKGLEAFKFYFQFITYKYIRDNE